MLSFQRLADPVRVVYRVTDEMLTEFEGTFTSTRRRPRG